MQIVELPDYYALADAKREDMRNLALELVAALKGTGYHPAEKRFKEFSGHELDHVWEFLSFTSQVSDDHVLSDQALHMLRGHQTRGQLDALNCTNFLPTEHPLRGKIQNLVSRATLMTKSAKRRQEMQGVMQSPPSPAPTA